MATIKAYSVARTQKSYDPTTATPASEVYSLGSGVPGAAATGRNGAYDHSTAEGLVEGRVPTLVVSGQTANDFDVTAVAITTNADGPIEVRNTAVIATTTTITGDGAGLIVRFTSTDADPTQIAAMTVVAGGENYDTGDTVEIDGYPGSVCTVTAE
jgi:hypothetical protein